MLVLCLCNSRVIKLLHYDSKNYIMAASAGSTEASAATLEELGLVALHSYGIMGCAVVRDQYGDEIRLVQLRNPWGDFEWTGDWGDSSELWTPELKRIVGFVDDSTDGSFWMSWKDLCFYFSRI